MILPQSLRVLVVDDNAYARALADLVLRQIGVGTVADAATGVEAVSQLLTTPFDVMLLDWYMPEMNGAALLQIIRAPSFGPNGRLPVIVATAYPNSETIARARELGADEVLSKPFAAMQLAGVIARLLPDEWQDLLGHEVREKRRVLL